MAITQPSVPDRNHIAKADAKRWAKHFGVTPELLEGAIGKVGTSVDAVQQEIFRQQLRTGRKNPDPNRQKTRSNKRTKPMEMQPSNEGAIAVPMASATSKATRNQRSIRAISRNQAENARNRALKKQRAAQKK